MAAIGLQPCRATLAEVIDRALAREVETDLVLVTLVAVIDQGLGTGQTLGIGQTLGTVPISAIAQAAIARLKAAWTTFLVSTDRRSCPATDLILVTARDLAIPSSQAVQ